MTSLILVTGGTGTLGKLVVPRRPSGPGPTLATNGAGLTSRGRNSWPPA
jgi:hypothetical protein